MNRTPWIIAGAVLVAAIIWAAIAGTRNANNTNSSNNNTNLNVPLNSNGNANLNSNLNINSGANTNLNGNVNTNSPSGAGTTPRNDDLIVVTRPLNNALVTSPLTVSGRARGTWYFEASFPVRLLDADGNEIAITAAQAQSSWMTPSYVNFTARLTFTRPATDTGTLILEKNNPSGLPQNADSLEIPVRFR